MYAAHKKACPEQAQGEAVTAASDMYSLGLVYHELFSGESPYELDLSLTGILLKVASADTFEVTGVDADLATLIERLKSLEPAARPTAIDAGERLRWIRDKPRRQRRRKLRAVATAFLALVAVVLGVCVIPSGAVDDTSVRSGAAGAGACVCVGWSGSSVATTRPPSGHRAATTASPATATMAAAATRPTIRHRARAANRADSRCRSARCRRTTGSGGRRRYWALSRWRRSSSPSSTDCRWLMLRAAPSGSRGVDGAPPGPGSASS